MIIFYIKNNFIKYYKYLIFYLSILIYKIKLIILINRVLTKLYIPINIIF